MELFLFFFIDPIREIFSYFEVLKYINQKIVKTPTALNEILIFFSIIAGLSSFGFWGMIIGPATVTFFISIIQLLKKHSKEYK